jgi:hypothetical protein
MGYDLIPNKDELDYFHFGAFSWPILLEACGYLFAEVNYMSKYYIVKTDDRFESARLTTNDGFEVTAEEAKIMARIAKNFVAVQRSLPEQGEIDIFAPAYRQPWPRKIRSDFVDRYEQFADWAERSNGFSIC